MIAVTGMHRSGTSCVTGLMERCGYSLGSSHTLLKTATIYNPKGHFENSGALSINDALLQKAGGSWEKPPAQALLRQAGKSLAQEIHQFCRTFDGDVVKDPRICLTVELWERYCQKMNIIVFCLRNPIGVARSLKNRNKISMGMGLQLWYEYNMRFFQSLGSTRVVIVDYDNMRENIYFEIEHLCEKLNSPLSSNDIRIRTEGFYESRLNHDTSTAEQIDRLPYKIGKLYHLIKSQTFSGHDLNRATIAG